jgi:hypothetical protein
MGRWSADGAVQQFVLGAFPFDVEPQLHQL